MVRLLEVSAVILSALRSAVSLHRVLRQMGVACQRLDIAVSGQLANYRNGLAETRALDVKRYRSSAAGQSGTMACFPPRRSSSLTRPITSIRYCRTPPLND